MGLPRWTSARNLFADLDLGNLDVVLRKQYYSLRNRIKSGSNVTVSAIFSCHAFGNSILCSQWHNSVNIVW